MRFKFFKFRKKLENKEVDNRKTEHHADRSAGHEVNTATKKFAFLKNKATQGESYTQIATDKPNTDHPEDKTKAPADPHTPTITPGSDGEHELQNKWDTAYPFSQP